MWLESKSTNTTALHMVLKWFQPMLSGKELSTVGPFTMMADEFDQSTFVCKGASKADLKPDSRKGSLDANCLRKHGLTAK